MALTQILRNQSRSFLIEFIRIERPEAPSVVPDDPRLQNFLGACDVFLEQVQETAPNIDAYVNPRATRIRFPTMLMNWLWPFTTQEHPLNSLPAPDHLRICFPQEVCDSSINAFMPSPRIGWRERYRRASSSNVDLADKTRERPRWTAAMLQALLPESESARTRRYSEALEAFYRTAPKAAMLDRFFELCRQKGLDIDRGADFAVWPDIERNFRDRQIFWDATHPTWSIFRSLCEKIARALPIPLSDTAIAIGLARLDASPPREAVNAPIHPAVAKHFGLRWCDEDTLFCLNPVEGMMTHREYVARYLRFDIDEDAYRGYWLTTRAASRQDLAAAETLLTEASARRPGNPHLDLAIATNLLWQGDRRERESLRRFEIASADPDISEDPRTHASIGHLHGRLGDRLAAIESYRKALQIKEIPAHRIRVAQHLAALGRLDEAIADMRLAIETDPFQSRWHTLLGRLLMRAKRGGEAQLAFQRAAETEALGERTEGQPGLDQGAVRHDADLRLPA